MWYRDNLVPEAASKKEGMQKTNFVMKMSMLSQIQVQTMCLLGKIYGLNLT